MTEYERMLDALPEEFFEWYAKATGLTSPLGTQIKPSEYRCYFQSYDVWPPTQEALWKMIDGPVTLSRRGLSLLWFGTADGVFIPDCVTLEEWLITAWGVQHGYRWTGSAWEKGASDGLRMGV